MDWRHFHVLAILSREGSLAAAAQALGVNHATISRRIASLYADVGELLVRRLGDITYGLFASTDHAALPSEEWRFIGFDEKLARTPQQAWL